MNKCLSTGMVVTAVFFIWSNPLIAAESPIEEIIVTAQKREENLQTVPLAISAFTGDFLDRWNIATLEDLEELVPGLNYDNYSAGQPRYYIRGVGNNLQSGSVEESVGTFVDGVYLERAAMSNIEFLDLERIEVLRGPQGTLFGRNVVGGAISIHSRKPSEDIRMGGNATFGKYDEITLKGYVSGPVADNVFASVASTISNRDGYAFNTTTNRDVSDKRYSAVRTAIRFRPTDNLDVQLNVDASRNRGTGPWWLLVLPANQPGPSWLESPWRNNNIDDDGINNVDNSGFSLLIDWNTAIGTWTSISAYRESLFHSRVHLTPPNIPPALDPALVVGDLSNILFQRDFTENADQISQEIRLASHPGDRLNWVAGLYYHQSDVSFRHDVNYKFILPGFLRDASSGNINDSTTDAFAVFANLTYDVTDALRLQIGARWSHDEKANTTTTYGIPTRGFYNDLDGNSLPPGVGYSVNNKKSWSATTPMFSVNYRLNDDVFLYSTISRGFKSGGFPGGQNDAITANTPFDPEFAWNYELGVKTEWSDRVRLNIAAYWMEYENLQVRALIPPVPPDIRNTRLFINAGEATVKGIETELNIAVTDNLSLYANHTYIDSRINKAESATAAVLKIGDNLIKTPKNTFFVGGSYVFRLNEEFSMKARASYSHTDEHFPQLPNNDFELIPSQSVINASLLFENQDGRWSVELWGKNLGDELNINSLTSVQGSTYGFADPPRTYGVTVRVRN